MCISYIKDFHTKKAAKISPFGTLRVDGNTRLIGCSFTGTTLDSVFWTSTTANGGTIAQANNQVTLSTSTTANGQTNLESVRTARYMSSNANSCRLVVRIPDSGVTNNIRRWGAFDSNNGLFFELNGSTLYVVSRKGGVDTKIESTAWNGDLGTNYQLSTNYQSYEILWSTTRIRFYIGDKLVHMLSLTDTPFCDTYGLKCSLYNQNSGGITTNVIMYCSVITIYRVGGSISRPVSNNITTNTTTVLKRGPGTLHGVIIGISGATSNTATIYDNTAASGTIIATLNTTQNTGFIQFSSVGVDFNIGLTVVTATGTAPNITVIYD